jgi:hypothetical protein
MTYFFLLGTAGAIHTLYGTRKILQESAPIRGKVTRSKIWFYAAASSAIIVLASTLAIGGYFYPVEIIFQSEFSRATEVANEGLINLFKFT